MKKTLSNARKNTKNLVKNVTAGMFLATTVAATDLVENLTTSVTTPTERILETAGNTADALGNTLKNTTKGNIFHTTWNLIMTPLTLLGTLMEGWIKWVGHSYQYISGISQTASNLAITTWESWKQLISTSDESPDISHKEIHLKEATDLELNGEHGLFGKKHKASSSKVLRWTNNVKNSIFNIPVNILRTGTDLISATTQRAKWVVESIRWIPKDIKSSRSGVFTKWQSFTTKFKKVFTHGLRWSVKSAVKWVLNIANEWVLKSGAAVVGTAGNFFGRLRGNTLKPLFSTKPAEEQSDNALEKTSRFKKLKSYYTSTPRSKDIKKEEKKEEKKNEEQKDEDLSADKAEGKSEQEEVKAEAKEEQVEEKKPEKKVEEVKPKQEKEEAVIPKEEEKKTEKEDKAEEMKEEEKQGKKKTKEETITPNDEKETPDSKKEDQQQESKKENAVDTLDPISMKKELWEALNKEQKSFASSKDRKWRNANGEYNEKYTAFINGLNKYREAWWRVVFTGMGANSGPVKSITIADDKVKVTYVPSPATITKEEETKLMESWKEKTDEISFKEVFCPDFSFYCNELTDKKEADTKEKENTEKKEEHSHGKEEHAKSKKESTEKK